MSTMFYARNKVPRIITTYDEYELGIRSNNDFYKTKLIDLDGDKFYFESNKELIDFISSTDRYDFVDEYGRVYTKEEMIKIISPDIIEKE